MSHVLVGRDRELDEFAERLATQRLVTVVGPGGVGKSVLAQVAADRAAHQFTGVGVVDLSRIGDDGAVPGAIAAQLGFDSFDAILASPTVPVLMVIDNCDHVVDGAASAVVQVLGACNQQTVIATSRSPLELPGESILSLGPLALPVMGVDPCTAPSVALFLERCRDAGVEVAARDLEAVVDLCHHLDGLPLAIEIAAARARSMTISEIATRLAGSIDVLDRPRYRGETRHRSLAATIDWSYGLLDAGTACMFEHLGVFAGPFSAHAARAVAGSPDDFDATLEDLVHASLVVVDTSGTDARYRLLDTVRRYALDQLTAHDGVALAYDRFVEYVLARMAGTVDALARSWRSVALVGLDVIGYDDIAEATRWCIVHDDGPQRALRLCEPLAAIAHESHADDIAELVRGVLERFPEPESTRSAHARAVLATAEYAGGNPREALEIAERTLERRSGADLTTLLLLRVLGRARHALGDNDAARDAFLAGAAVSGELDMIAMTHELQIAAALCLADAGHVDDALAAMTAIVDDAMALGSTVTATWASMTRSWVLVRVDPAAALVEADAALDVARELGMPSVVAVGLRAKAFAHLMLDDLAAATTTVDELSENLLDRGALSSLRMVADVGAALAFRAGHPLWSRLVATARSLPITTPVCSSFEPIPIPLVDDPPLSRPAVVNATRTVIDDIAAGRTGTPAMDGSGGPRSAAVRQLGQFCELEFDGRAVAVRASKGITNVTQLLAAAGREIHCTELAGVSVEQSTTGEVIDADARRHYEDRIRDLHSDIEEAEDRNDFGRAYALQVELESLIEHLSASLGRGNQTRRGTDNTERARSAVTHRLRATIRQLAKAHPTLGQHLEHSIRTGTYCSYQPERPVEWSFQ